MKATTPLPTQQATTGYQRNAGRRIRRLFHHNDNPAGVDRHALPSELALRPIEPHYPMHR